MRPSLCVETIEICKLIITTVRITKAFLFIFSTCRLTYFKCITPSLPFSISSGNLIIQITAIVKIKLKIHQFEFVFTFMVTLVAKFNSYKYRLWAALVLVFSTKMIILKYFFVWFMKYTTKSLRVSCIKWQNYRFHFENVYQRHDMTWCGV